MDIFTKYQAEVWDYDVDFSRSLPDGDTLLSATVAVAPVENMVSCARYDVQTVIVKVWLNDGLPGSTATVTVIAVTAQGRTVEEQFKIRVRG